MAENAQPPKEAHFNPAEKSSWDAVGSPQDRVTLIQGVVQDTAKAIDMTKPVPPGAIKQASAPKILSKDLSKPQERSGMFGQPPDIPREVELDKVASPEEKPSFQATYDPTKVEISTPLGKITMNYEMVIFSESGTSLLLGEHLRGKKEPTLVLEEGDIDLVIHNHDNRLKCSCLSFKSSFVFEGWHLTVLGLREMTEV